MVWNQMNKYIWPLNLKLRPATSKLFPEASRTSKSPSCSCFFAQLFRWAVDRRSCTQSVFEISAEVFSIAAAAKTSGCISSPIIRLLFCMIVFIRYYVLSRRRSGDRWPRDKQVFGFSPCGCVSIGAQSLKRIVNPVLFSSVSSSHPRVFAHHPRV